MLNDLIIRKLATPINGVDQHPDGKIPGFGVRVTARGVKTFYLAYRFQGRSRRLNLGHYPTTSLQKARGKAFAALSKIEDGKDPAGRLAQTENFSDAVSQFVSTYCAQQNRPSTAAETERLLTVYFLPAWKNRTITSISRADVAQALDPIMRRGSPASARHAFASIRKMFNWLVEQGMLTASPCAGMAPPAKAGSRDRVLTDAELKAVWDAAIAIGFPFGPIVLLLVLTAQRRGEVVGMAWSEIDEARAIWTIPGDRTKNGKAHAVPLCAQALSIIKAQPRTTSPYVFPARGKPEQPYSGYSKGKRELDAVAQLDNWTLHDLRRTAATGMAALGIAPHVVERVLNHVSGTFAGVAGIYNRFGYEEEMRAALNQWSQKVSSLTSIDG